jgi:hypothetical protein
MRKLGFSRGPQPRKPRLGMLPHRRIGRARAYDVHDNATGTVIVRNVTAATVAATYAPSLTAEAVIDSVAQHHFVDSDGVRVSAHMAIGT